jgi:hypothetical protein
VRRAVLARATNPMPFRLAAGLTDQCVMLQFEERPAYMFVYDYDELGDPIPGTRRIAVNGSRRNRWEFRRDAVQSPCNIKGLEVRPDAFTVNRPTQVRLEARVTSTAVTGLQSYSVDDTLEVVQGPLCALHDDGRNGDEVAGDRVHSCLINFFENDPTILRLIVKGHLSGQEVVSPKAEIDVVPELIEEDAAVFLENMYRARDIWGEKLAQYGNTRAAREQTVNAVRALPYTRDVAYDDHTFLLEFAVADYPGILGILPVDGSEPLQGSIPQGAASQLPEPPANQSPAAFMRYENVSSYPAQAVALPEDHRVKSTDVLIWSPFHDRFSPQGELEALQQRFASNACPRFKVRLLRNEECTVASVRKFPSYGTVILATEGYYPARGWTLLTDFLYSKDPVFVTGQLASALNIVLQVADTTIRHYIGKLGIPGIPARRAPHLMLYADKERGVVWAVRPSFIESLPKRFPESIVFGGFRRSSTTLAMAQAFLASGAGSYFGFSGVARRDFVRQTITDLFGHLLNQESVAQAFANVAHKDPESDAVLYFSGDGRPTYLGLTNVVNGDFEKSTLTSWNERGDARVVSSLGPYLPRQGAYMALLTTGLGGTYEDGLLRQSVCVPELQRRLVFDWNFLSEEFLNWCGQGFDDEFVARVNGLEVYRRSVEGLCGSPLTPLPGFVLAYGDDVFATGWQNGSIDLTPLLGSGATSVDLEFGVADGGDSIVDSAVLLDRIRFE